MPHLSADSFRHLVEAHGAWAVALVVAVESAGIPVPGETILVVAALYAGQTHRLGIGSVITAAVAGAVLGDNIGFLVGREGGYRILRRYGKVIHVDERRLKLGIYLFRRHGGLVVFLGRFVAVLRAWAAFLAGTNCMPWPRFLVANAAGAVVWAGTIGLAAYLFGEEAARVGRTVGYVLLAVAVAGLITAAIAVRRHERQLEDEAERALPGPLNHSRP